MAPCHIPREVELKITAVTTPGDFIARVDRLGAELAIDRRLLRSRIHGLTESCAFKSGTMLRMRTAIFHPDDRAKKLGILMGLLGFPKGSIENDRFVVEVPAQLPDRMIRLRQDRNELIWTVKGPIDKKNPAVKDRPEAEVRVLDAEAILRWILTFGYEEERYQEWFRWDWRLGPVSINLNEAPGNIFWGEAEAPNFEIIEKTVEALGYQMGRDTSPMNVSQYLETQGLTDAQINNLRFP